MADFFWFSDAQWARIEPLLPTGTRGMKRVDDRRVLCKHPVRAAGAQAVSRFGQRNGAEPRTKPRNAAWSGNATLKPGMPSTKNP